jgi:RNA polymerase sigma factor (sigma-70 family)
MSGQKSYQELVSLLDTQGFYERLVRGEADAWQVVIDFIRLKVQFELRSRPIPKGFDYEEAVAEFTNEASYQIVENLEQYAATGKLSAYLGKITQRAIPNYNYKAFMQAMGRFLKAAVRFAPDYQQELCALILTQNPDHRQLLMLRAQGASLKLINDGARQTCWRTARLELAHTEGFIGFVNFLAGEGIRQAQTLMKWWQVLQAERAAPARSDDENEDGLSVVLDCEAQTTYPAPSAALVRDETTRLLHECLSKLAKKSEDNYRAVVLHYVEQKSYAEISTLVHAKQSTLRQRVRRGLKYLHDCMDTQLNPEVEKER